MKTRLFILILLGVFTVSCSPLRKIQKSETHQTHIDDSLLTELVRQEVTRSLLDIKQTEVEFFPPVLESPDSLPQSVPVRQAVKKITVTEVSSCKDSKTVTDSTTNVTHHEDTHTKSETSTKEKPSEALSWVRYTAVILALILLLIIIIKIRL